MDQTDAWLIFNASALSLTRQQTLLEAFTDAPGVLGAADVELLALDGITRQHVEALRRTERELDLADLRQRMMYFGISLLPISDAKYPRLLRETPDAPPLLFVHGEISSRDDLTLAVVGTRKCSPYGAKIARRLAAELARRGFTIVSGMALGVDAEAHEGALEAGGRTIAVMASGPDVTYPASHKNLRQRIAGHGAVITEQCFGREPMRELFPSRNRIIAGLSLGTLVVEAPSRSGALITANLAADYGREIMAVPGDIDNPNSHGCHHLLKNGARLIEVAEDAIEALGILLDAVPVERPRRDVQVTGEERAVLEALSFEPRHVDEVLGTTGLPTARVNSALMLLEMKGLVRRFPGNTYVRL